MFEREPTGDKSGTQFKRGITECIRAIAQQPQACVSTNFIIEDGEQGEKQAGPEGLDAIRQGVEETNWYQCPAKDGGIVDRYATRRERPVSFVLLVLFHANNLVGDVEMENV